jgi:hypothetical protein
MGKMPDQIIGIVECDRQWTERYYVPDYKDAKKIDAISEILKPLHGRIVRVTVEVLK